MTEAELKIDKDSRTLDHIEKDLITEAEDKTKNGKLKKFKMTFKSSYVNCEL